MRTLHVSESISIDGYFTDQNSDLGWARASREDPEFGSWMGKNASRRADLLFGRKTYQMMEAFWPTPAAAKQMPEVARGMNTARKYVASNTIEPTWNNTLLLEGDLVDAVRGLKATDGPDVVVLGSGSVVAQPAKQGWSIAISLSSSPKRSAAAARYSQADRTCV